MTGAAVAEDVKRSFSSECGCPEIHCTIYPFDVEMHLDPDGGDVFFDCGEYDFEVNFEAKTIDELLEKAVQHVQGLYDQYGWV